MPLDAGTRLGPYEIVAPLGAGGMGEVYRARDERLGREVALKILAPDVAQDPSRLDRFAREARAIAALNHPHIVTIYSTEEAGGVRFLTMELIEGHTLDALIPSGGLPVTRFLEIAVPLADALAAAHRKHVLHRDLKPANIMIAADGRVKVLDFGLARVGAQDPDDRTVDATRAALTREGTVVGTMPYMSPEQIEGKPLDHRSDLFSLGIMFYEMLAAVRPFQGDSSPLLMSAILRDTPPAVTEYRPDAPDALARLIARCLEKQPDDRVQTARDVHNELRHTQKQLDSGAAGRGGSGSVAARLEESPWIAVLPFTAAGSDVAAAEMAGGLTEDLSAGLSRFPYLHVVAEQFTRQFKGANTDVRAVGGQLGARYLLDGTVRRASSSIRVTARLVDTSNAAQLWSDSYKYDLQTLDGLAVQDDVTDRVVATVADVYGVLLRSMSHRLHGRSIAELGASELALRYWAYQRHHAAPEHARLRDAFEQLAAREPNHPDSWASLAHLYCHEQMFGFNTRPDSLRRAHHAVMRALALDSVSQHAWEALAVTYFFDHDRDAFVHAAERAMALNPRNTNTVAWIGSLFAHMGEHERGCEITERAMALNPHHPGWYHFAFFIRHYHRREFADALRAAKKINMPDHPWSHWAIAVAAAQLGRKAEATAALDGFLAIAPELADEDVLRVATGRWRWDDESAELDMDGFRKAVAFRLERATQDAAPTHPSASGARLAPPSPEGDPQSQTGRTASDTAAPATSSAAQKTSGMWIAVLPFTSRAGDDESSILAEGLTDDITAGLSRFSYLRVVSRASVERAKEDTTDVHAASARAGARYLLEGNVRNAGGTVRVSVRLVDAETDTHLWAENYDRQTASGVFALQDDIASRVVATVANSSGVLIRSMVRSLKEKPIDELTIFELVLRFQAYVDHFRPEEHARLRDGFERALTREPGNASAWARLAMLYEHEYSHRLNPLPDPLGRQRRAAERAVEIDPMNQHGWMALISTNFFGRDLPGLRASIDRAIDINPLNADSLAFAGLFLSGAGETDRAVELVREASTLNPHHPGWYHFVPFNHAYKRQEYEEALLHAKRVNMPLFPWSHLSSAAAAGQLGRVPEARAAIDALARIDPSFLDLAHLRLEWGLWFWDEHFLDRLIEGVEKARNLSSSAPPSGS